MQERLDFEKHIEQHHQAEPDLKTCEICWKLLLAWKDACDQDLRARELSTKELLGREVFYLTCIDFGDNVSTDLCPYSLHRNKDRALRKGESYLQNLGFENTIPGTHLERVRIIELAVEE